MNEQIIVFKNPNGPAFAADWLRARGFSYRLTTTPAGSPSVVSAGGNSFWQEQTRKKVEQIDPRLYGALLMSQITPTMQAQLDKTS